jgi:hypothetical protein
MGPYDRLVEFTMVAEHKVLAARLFFWSRRGVMCVSGEGNGIVEVGTLRNQRSGCLAAALSSRLSVAVSAGDELHMWREYK